VATEAPFAVLEGLEVWLVPPRSIRSTTIVSVRSTAKGPLVRLADCGHIDLAATLVGSELLARTTDLPEAWFIDVIDDDVTGYSVKDVVHGDLGEVVDIIVTGANDVWEVEGPLGEVLIPVIDDVVLDIDDDARAITVRLLDGLLPGEGDEA
jgi:16S rRNA processing protein RimM